MAWTASGLYYSTFADVLDTTQLALDLDLETHKLAHFSNTITPNFSTDTAYGVAPYNANEVTGTNWPAGGVVITGTTVSEDPTGTLKWDGTDISVSTVTVTNARGGLVYADALAGNNAISGHNYGADYSSTAGTFQVLWPATGIWYVDLTP